MATAKLAVARMEKAQRNQWRELAQWIQVLADLGLREHRSCYFLAVPFLRILALVVALTNMVGLADIVLSDACEEMCKDDGCDKDCPPGMACHCHCPSAVPCVGTVQLVGTIDTPQLVEACSDEQQAHASPDPREILRVPIAAV